jgi:hypothetical protein
MTFNTAHQAGDLTPIVSHSASGTWGSQRAIVRWSSRLSPKLPTPRYSGSSLSSTDLVLRPMGEDQSCTAYRGVIFSDV